MSRSRRRSIYCDPVKWVDIVERARSVNMNTSAFVIACALQEEEPERPDTVLALTAEEQRLLFDRIAMLDRCSRGLLEPIPGIGMSMFEALAVLCRIHGGEDKE